MKLHRANRADVADMITLWPLVRPDFSSFDDVVRQYHAAYPMAQADEYVRSFIEGVAHEAEGTG